MSVYPEFLEYIQNEGLYVPGYNYEEMYNIMVDSLTTNNETTNNFIYTHQQISNLYEVLEELLYPYSEIESEANEQNGQPIPTNNIYTTNTNQTALQAFNNYIINALNNSNNNNDTIPILYNMNYNNIVYYNNT